VHLLKRNLDEAAAQYQLVVDRYPTRKGDLEGTQQQAARICKAFELSPEATAKVLAPFRLLEE
jgi:hypothetical protein